MFARGSHPSITHNKPGTKKLCPVKIGFLGLTFKIYTSHNYAYVFSIIILVKLKEITFPYYAYPKI